MVQEGSSTQGGVLQEASGCQLCLQTSVISIVLHPPWRAKSLSPKFTGAESVFLPNVDQLQPELKKKKSMNCYSWQHSKPWCFLCMKQKLRTHLPSKCRCSPLELLAHFLIDVIHHFICRWQHARVWKTYGEGDTEKDNDISS